MCACVRVCVCACVRVCVNAFNYFSTAFLETSHIFIVLLPVHVYTVLQFWRNIFFLNEVNIGPTTARVI